MQVIFRTRFFGLAKASNIVLIAVILLTAIPLAVQAQRDINGIFEPRSAEEFFEEGRRQLERETQQLLNRERDSSEPLLDIDSDLLVQDEAFREERESWLKNTDLLPDTTDE